MALTFDDVRKKTAISPDEFPGRDADVEKIYAAMEEAWQSDIVKQMFEEWIGVKKNPIVITFKPQTKGVRDI